MFAQGSQCPYSAFLSHPCQLRRLAGAGRGEHGGVCDARVDVEEASGGCHAVILGVGFLYGVTVFDSVNADPGFHCKQPEM